MEECASCLSTKRLGSIMSGSMSARPPSRRSALTWLASRALQCGAPCTPVPVQSWRQFQAYFGDCTGAGYLAYAVRAFFENGGRRCWVVRGVRVGATAEVVLRGPPAPSSGPPPLQHDIWTIQAFSPGVWGNDLEIMVRETHRAQTLTDPQHSARSMPPSPLYRVHAGDSCAPLAGDDPDLESRFRR